jgi:Fungal specific transcription factor domain
LPSSNCWLVDLGPMLAGNECLRHTLLSLACTYVLDYLPDENLRRRANHHYERAVKLLSDSLHDASEQAVGKGDALVGAITLFNMHDVVTWEARRDKNFVPRWLEGARLASTILDSTDPGYRYYKAGNVQASNARISNTIIVGRAAILVLTVLPLNVDNTKQKFNWLLHGSERESRKIHGGCGLSPKLLHHFSQITHIAASLGEDPEGPMIGMYAEKLEQRLQNLRQWSELSHGYNSVQALFDACILNEEGAVETASQMTDLTGEAWRVAAQIYLQCRLLRLPRTHPKVIQHVHLLAGIVRRMPCAGPLFTAQAPFLPVFLLGLVSTLPEHRDAARQWFETVITASSCRSVGFGITP